MSPPESSFALADCDLERLKRRLERERAARREAEAIAEKGLRELWDRQRQLALIGEIAQAANQARTVNDVLRFTLERVCELTGWPVGHVYRTRRTRKGAVMAPTTIWMGAQDATYAAFRRISETLEFQPGVGLPGRVLESREPLWVPDVLVDPQFPRSEAAKGTGLRAGIAFPVLVGDRVEAVLEFFATSVLPPDEDLLRVMGQVGAQLGRTIERERAERSQRDKNARLRRALDEADTQRRAAEAASRAKSAFLAVTSHEVRTPLNAVLGLAEGLRREPLTPHQGELAEGIVDAGAMLLRLLNAVLDLSKIESGQLNLEPTPFALETTLDTIVRVWSAKACELDVALELDLSALPRPCGLLADEGKIEQTLINLLSNALKFSPPGSRVRVAASARACAGQMEVRLSVADQGPGVAENDRERIFRPYEQTSLGRDAGGAGLGLAICSGHLALMGGRLAVEPAEGGGSVFTAEFIASPVEVEAAPLAPEVAPERALAVLVAEDNPANRRVIQVLLQPAGVNLTFAENGAEALTALGQSDFDVVLMDANMPVMDGVAAVRAIRGLSDARAAMPVHMLTANAFDDDVRRYLAAGADGVLRKPVEVDALYRLLGAVASGAARRVAA